MRTTRIEANVYRTDLERVRKLAAERGVHVWQVMPDVIHAGIEQLTTEPDSEPEPKTEPELQPEPRPEPTPEPEPVPEPAPEPDPESQSRGRKARRRKGKAS